VLTRFLGDPDAASRSIIDQVKTFISAFFGIIGLVAVLIYTAWKLAIIGVTVKKETKQPVLPCLSTLSPM
jgi:ABC-type multidrug transport system fused ATPase/permease subunit